MISYFRWDDLIPRLSCEGYGGITIEVAHDACDVYDQVDRIREAIVKEKLTPPVMISHSRSSYLGLKFLESHALSGLIMINPQLKLMNNSHFDSLESITHLLSINYKTNKKLDKYYQKWLDSSSAAANMVNYCNLFIDPVELEPGKPNQQI